MRHSLTIPVSVSVTGAARTVYINIGSGQVGS